MHDTPTPLSPPLSEPLPRSTLVRIAAASFTGTAAEFYDFFAYGTAAALVLGPLFFPGASPLAGTLAAFGTYAVGFLARPLGALLFGHIGDRHGRRPVLIASLLTTGLATVLVGLVPPYRDIGVAAPIVLIALRFAQGIGVGGEWGGAVLLAAEHAPPRRRGLWTAIPQCGPSLGFLLANGIMLALSATLTDAQFRSWGWRVPFLAASLLLATGLALRVGLPETPDFEHEAATGDLARVPALDVLRSNPRTLLLAGGTLVCGSAVYYAVTAWALAYATASAHVPRTLMLGCIMAAVAVQGVVMLPLAVLGDRYGRRRVAMAGCAVSLLWPWPLVRVLAGGDPKLITCACAVALAGFVLMFAQTGAYLPELFPARVRCTGASTAYNLGSVGGALTPIVATALGHGAGVPWGVAVWLSGTALLSLACFAALPETATVIATAAPDLSPA